MTAALAPMTADQIAASAAAVAAANKTNGIAATSGGDAQTQLSGDFSFFLKMLTTQLKNQDPTQPMDTSQMTQQIATFSGVQQQVATNTKLDSLIANNKTSAMSTGVSYIGSEVESAGSTGNVYAGQGAFSYNLPSAASSVNVVITDKSGNTVFQGAGTTNAGRNIIVWDGINSSTGAQEPDGTYHLAVTAKDSTGAQMTVTNHAVGIVSGVETDSAGNVLLNIGDAGGTQVNLADVLAVRTPSRVNTSSNSNTNTSGTGT